MAKFILVKDEKETLLNLEHVLSITPYTGAYDDEDEINGVSITFYNRENPIVYGGLDFEELKRILLEK